MPNILEEIVQNKRTELSALSSSAPPAVRPALGTFLPSLRASGTRIITEIKPKSPSAGVLNTTFNLPDLVHLYSKYAAAISVLTDTKYFGGTMSTLAETASLTQIPTLCKDFIIDPLQVLQARAAGAEAVLLIVKILTDSELNSLHSKIKSLNMTPVVEIQSAAELARAARVAPDCILINNRNLETFEIDLDTTTRLAPAIRTSCSPDTTIISASGIETSGDLQEIQRATNIRVFLIGSSLMKSPDIESKLKELLQCS